MKYFIRSVKYFIHFALLATLIIVVLIMVGAVGNGTGIRESFSNLDINQVFEGGYDAIWKIALIFAAVSAIYPKFAFITRRLDVQTDWNTLRSEATEYLREKGYRVETDEAAKVTFRRIGLGSRIVKMGEDRVTLTMTDEGFFLDGLRKDIMTFSSSLEYRLSDNQ